MKRFVCAVMALGLMMLTVPPVYAVRGACQDFPSLSCNGRIDGGCTTCPDGSPAIWNLVTTFQAQIDLCSARTSGCKQGLFDLFGCNAQEMITYTWEVWQKVDGEGNVCYKAGCTRSIDARALTGYDCWGKLCVSSGGPPKLYPIHVL